MLLLFSRRLSFLAGWFLLCSTALAPARGEGLPIVFVPGTGGSRLVEPTPTGKFKRLWISPSLLTDGAIGRIALGPGLSSNLKADDLLRSVKMNVSVDLIIDAPLEPDEAAMAGLELDEPFRTNNLLRVTGINYPIYGDFVEWAKTEWIKGTARWYDVPYDWRKGACEENAEAIDRRVTQALKESGRDQVVLLAHSLGGLVCRDYISRGDNARKVRALIAVGTPWLGAPKAARGLRWGFDFGLGGRLDPPDATTAEGIYIFYRDKDKKQRRLKYMTMVAMIDPDRMRDVARTFPCVYQQLPTSEFMNLYGGALPWRTPTSIFADLSVTETLAFYEKTGAASEAAVGSDLYRDALRVRGRLDGNSRGVVHHLIAGVCDPSINGEIVMTMRVARVDDPALEWSNDSRPDLGRMTLDFGRWSRRLIAARFQFDKSLAQDFFRLNPMLQDFGNYNWHLVRELAMDQVLKGRRFPIYVDHVIGVDPDVMWGDGTSPLLSATAGARVRGDDEAEPNLAAARSKLGKSTTVDVVKLTVLDKGAQPRGAKEFSEHSNMLEDPEVKRLIRERYAAANH